jgi:hypothetical protein
MMPVSPRPGGEYAAWIIGSERLLPKSESLACNKHPDPNVYHAMLNRRSMIHTLGALLGVLAAHPRLALAATVGDTPRSGTPFNRQIVVDGAKALAARAFEAPGHPNGLRAPTRAFPALRRPGTHASCK